MLGKKQTIHKPGTKALDRAIKSSDLEFIDFLKQCLMWEPEARLTPEKGLFHPWILNRKKSINSIRNTDKREESKTNSQAYNSTRQNNEPNQDINTDKFNNTTKFLHGNMAKITTNVTKDDKKALIKFKERLKTFSNRHKAVPENKATSKEPKKSNSKNTSGIIIQTYSTNSKIMTTMSNTSKAKLKQSNIF